MKALLFFFFVVCSVPLGADQGSAVSKNLAIANAARERIGITVKYVPDYVSMDYPGGDVPQETGVCTDVVIRSLRKTGHDLQKLLHEDMKKNFASYPTIWNLRRPDRNIDHRRVPNLRAFFSRKGKSLKVTQKPSDYLPGDLVTCTVAGKLPHIMVVSNKKSAKGIPLVIHNIGAGTKEENRLFDFPITGHYRFFRN